MDKQVEKPESIRGWYRRTTKNSRTWFVMMTVVALSVMMGMWVMAPMATLGRLQTFNGALTVPLIGGLWIFAFIFMFLVPSREASFRAQEALEDGITTMKRMIEESVIPAAKALERILLKVEKEYPEMRKRVEESLVELRETSKKVEKALENNAEFVGEARPVLQALKRIEERIEEDLLDDLKLAAEAVRRMGGMPAAAPKPVSAAPAAAPVPDAPDDKPATAPDLSKIPPEKEPKLNVALASIANRKKKEAASSQPK